MKKIFNLSVIAGCFLANSASSDSVMPLRTIRANTVITEHDVAVQSNVASIGFTRVADVIGQEARVALYPGRPVLAGDIGPPSIVSRNQIVPVTFTGAGLNIRTEARALERGAVGDRIRVMNLASRATLFGQILEDGTIQVRQ